jgi:hypothetical protein
MLTHGTHPATNRPLTEDDITTLAEQLNDTAVTCEDMPAFLARQPRACVLRHAVRPALNRFLASNNSGHAGYRPIVWRQRDEATAKHGSRHGKPLSSEVMSVLAQRTPKANDIPAVQYFYPGIPYRFVSNECPLLGWVNNGTCTGERIILHADEPVDDLQGDFWTLKYPPQAIIVRIDGRDTGDMFGDPVPSGCVPVFPIKSQDTMKHDWGRDLRLYASAHDNTKGSSITYKRFGFPMDPVNTFTDYYAQGQSFKGAPHFLHLHVDKGSPWTKANLLVPISRAATWSDVKLAHPLWNAGDNDKRAAIIKSMSNALAPKPAYVAELARLEECHQNTYNVFYDNLMNAHDDMDVDDDEPLAPAPVLPTVRYVKPPTTTSPTRTLQLDNDKRRQVWVMILMQMTCKL